MISNRQTPSRRFTDKVERSAERSQQCSEGYPTSGGHYTNSRLTSRLLWAVKPMQDTSQDGLTLSDLHSASFSKLIAYLLIGSIGMDSGF